MSEDFCGGALSTAAELSNRLQHSDTEFQRFPQRTLSPISLIMSINIRKRVGSVEDLPERSTSLPGASSQCGTLHLNGCTSFCSAIPHHILCFPEEPVRCPCNTLLERNVLHKKRMLDGIPDIFVKLYIAGCRKIMLMYGREAQSKTRIASPATIPKSGERNRKIHSCMLYLISI